MASLAQYDAIDPTFAADLAASGDAVWHVAKWLQDRGHHVIVRAVRVRPTPEAALEYSDAGDLEILQRVEVARRGFEFTNAADYPFETVFVDNAHSFDGANPKPFAYVLLNRSMTHAAIVDGRTCKHWRKTSVSSKGLPRTLYECPLELVTFTRITPREPGEEG